MAAWQVTLAILGFGAVVYDVYATLVLSRSVELTKSQRTVQLLIVWLLPVVGALTIVHLHSESGQAPYPLNPYRTDIERDYPNDSGGSIRRDNYLGTDNPVSSEPSCIDND